MCYSLTTEPKLWTTKWTLIRKTRIYLFVLVFYMMINLFCKLES